MARKDTRRTRSYTTTRGIVVTITGGYGRNGKERGHCGDFKVWLGGKVLMDGFGQLVGAKEWADKNAHRF